MHRMSGGKECPFAFAKLSDEFQHQVQKTSQIETVVIQNKFVSGTSFHDPTLSNAG